MLQVEHQMGKERAADGMRNRLVGDQIRWDARGKGWRAHSGQGATERTILSLDKVAIVPVGCHPLDHRIRFEEGLISVGRKDTLGESSKLR